jgi:hypothetical protein
MIAAVWWHLVRGKERARQAASGICKQYGLQLMDDTVMLDAIELQHMGESKGYGLKYRFDYVREGLLRQGGSVFIMPGHPARVVIQTRDGQLIVED